jgi:hypothetical protein
MALKKKIQSIALTGIVIPVDWNDDHDVIVAALATADEKEYRITGNRKGKELFAYLQRQVEAEGILGKDEEGRAVITVKRYLVK